MNELYIGIMSGTSMDGVDVALCKISENSVTLLSALEYPFDLELKEEILEAISSAVTLQRVGLIDNRLGHLFSDAVSELIKRENIDIKNVKAIGLHGQTLWHEPNGENPFSMQLGCPNVVSSRCKIPVVADFRRMDIANGGQGAPFAPVFHKEVFKSLDAKVGVLNLGGISNITILGDKLQGYDIGPANVLMDYWIDRVKSKSYDKDGEFAKSGELNKVLLNVMLNEEYFSRSAPKSTGRELFNKEWLNKVLCKFPVQKTEDVQRTLLELTVQTVADELRKNSVDILILCGGGAKNSFLVERINSELKDIKVALSDEYGVSSEYMEAMAFAWFAYKRVHNQKVELSFVTGAKIDSVLGGIYG